MKTSAEKWCEVIKEAIEILCCYQNDRRSYENFSTPIGK
jgi:hypothetical protein